MNALTLLAAHKNSKKLTGLMLVLLMAAQGNAQLMSFDDVRGVSSVRSCYGRQARLIVPDGTDEVIWSDAARNEVGRGKVFVTPPLTSETGYWWQYKRAGAEQSVTVTFGKPEPVDFTVPQTSLCLNTINQFSIPSTGCSGNAFIGDGLTTGASSAPGVYPTLEITNVTMDARVKWTGPTAAKSHQFIMYNGNSGSSGYGIYVDGATKKVNVLLGGVAFLTSNTELAVNRWQQVTATCREGIWSLFVDGTEFSLQRFAAVPNPVADGRFTIGQSTDGVQHFNGAIDEVTIWNHGSYREELNQVQGLCVSEVFYQSRAGFWEFNENSGLVVKDAGRSGTDLTLNNASRALSATYTWDFGDGTTATGLQVSHKYTSLGNKNITLRADQAMTCPGFTTKTVAVVNAIPSGVTPITASATTICSGQEVNLSTNYASVLSEDFTGDEASLRSRGWVPNNPWNKVSRGWRAGGDPQLAKEGSLTSPAFSTVGRTGLHLTLSQYIVFFYKGNAGYVRMSTDKQNWANIKVYPVAPDDILKYNSETPDPVYIPIPAAFENKPQVYLQFYYKDSSGERIAGNAGWWLYNVLVTDGTTNPAPVLSWSSNPPGFSVLDVKSVTVKPWVTTTYSAYGNSGCLSAAQTIKIIVNPSPVPVIKAPASTCVGGVGGRVVFKGSGATAPYTFYYTINNGPVQTLLSGAGDSAWVPFGADPFTPSLLTYKLTRIVSASGCDSLPPDLTATIQVNQSPGASIVKGGSFCTGGAVGTVAVIGLNGTRPYTFNYEDAANNNYRAVSAPGSDTAFITVPRVAGSYKYQVVYVTDSNGCFNIVANDVNTTATMYATPVVNLSTNYAIYCSTPNTISATGASSYTWSPAAGLSSTSGSTVQASPSTSTTYTVKGTNGVCTDSSTVVIAVTGPPVATTASLLAPCYGTPVSLKAGDSVYADVPVFMQDFNKPLSGWVLKNGSTSGIVANAAWTFRQTGYTYTLDGKIFTFNPGNGFYMTNASHQDSEHFINAATSLQSPAFSTVGFTNMKVTLNDLFLYYNTGGALAKVQLSTDLNNWTDISVRSGRGVNIDSTTFSSLAFTVPAAFENKPVVYIRFAYNNTLEGLWWAINNVLITGNTTNSWQWYSTPAGFTSAVRNPTVASVTSDATYYVTVTNSAGCAPTTGNTGKVTVASAIEGSIDTVIRVLPGTSSYIVNHKITKGSPDRFAVVAALPNKMPGWPASYQPQLDAAPAIPILTAQRYDAATYNFTWQAFSSTSGCVMAPLPYRLIIGNNNNNLASLTSPNFTLSPVFDPASTAYVATIDHSLSSITVTPVAADATAIITVNGVPVASGAASQAIATTSIGAANIVASISINVTAQDGTVKNYFILVKKTANTINTGVTTDAKQAYSLRGLTTSYLHSTGAGKPAMYAVIRVRRSSDNTESDIPYNSTTFNLDTAALKAFAGTGDAFVTKWYDQSGNDIDAVQTVAASQPRIVKAGVIDRKNNVPTIYFGSTPFNYIFLTTTPFTGFNNGVSIFAAAGAEGDWPYTAGSQLVSKTSGGQPGPFAFNGMNFVVGDASRQTTQAHNLNATTGFAVFGFTGALATAPVAYTNGVASTNAANLPQAFNDAGTAVIIGSNAEGNGRLAGWISEMVLFPQVTADADRAAITSNQIAYYLSPVINSIVPAASGAGTTIAIKGSILSNVTAVKFGNVAAQSFTVQGDSLISAVIPAGAGGTVSVSTSSKTATFPGFKLITPPGNALYFNGVNNYVKTNTNPIAGNDFTIEFWMRTKQTGTSGGLQWYYGTGLVDGDVPYLANDFGISLLGNKICFGTGGSSDVSITSKTIVNTGNWVHVAAVRSKTNGTISLYINGVRDTVHNTGTAVLNDAALTYLTVAANRSLTSYFKGSIDELRFFNTDRSDVILNDMLGTVSQQLPAAYYTFDAGIAAGNNAGVNTLSDVTGNGNSIQLGSQFTLADTIANWVESYAMVVPVATAATGITASSFTANWAAQALGVADSFKVSVATDAAFTNIVTGYDSVKIAGNKTTLTITGLAPGTTYYYRVRAHKASVAGQGGYGPPMPVTTAVLAITGVTPASAGVGTPVTITGSGFTGVTAVSFGGTPALNFTFVNDNTVKAVVGNGATGTVSLTAAGNNISKAAAFTLLTQTPPGNALYFDGSTNYVKTRNNPIKGNDFTIEFWMKPNVVGATGTNWYNGTAIVDGDVSGLARDFGVSLVGDKLCFGTGGTVDFSIKSKTAVALGQWVHVAAVRNITDGTISLYINGVQDTVHSSGSVVLASSALTYLTVGANRSLTTHFNGVIDELKFYNSDRSLLINEDMLNKANNPQDSLAATYNFDQGIVGADNTGITLLVDQGPKNITDTLLGFTNNTPSTIWTESYAMVFPGAGNATAVTTTGFTANWPAPAIGVANKYYLDVSEKADFSTFVTGYNNLDVGNVLLQNVTGLKPGTVYYYRVRAYKNSTVGLGINSVVNSVKTYTVASWTGTVSTDWNNATNWGSNTVPSANDDVTIPASAPNYPVINTTAVAHGITIATGASLRVVSKNTLSISGDVVNNGTFNASEGTLVFNGALAQSITGGLTVNNLTLDNKAGITLLGGITKVYGTYTPATGVLNTNGYLVLASNTAGTAMVANAGDNFNYVSGAVTVERFIPAKRAWRLLTAPLSNTGSIFSNWQNNGSANDSTGVEMFSPTGTGAAGNGLTKAGVAASVKTYNSPVDDWDGLESTNVTDLSGSNNTAANNAYALFVTGPYGSNTITSGAKPATLQAAGLLQTGAQNFSFTGVDKDKYVLIGNPYAAPINFATIQKNNVYNTMWTWDAQLPGLGGYVMFSYDAVKGVYDQDVTGTAQTTVIQSGQAFFVQADGTSTTAGVIIQESDKASIDSSKNTVFFAPAGSDAQQLRVTLNKAGAGLDGVLVKLDDAYKQALTDDGAKLFGYNENLSIRVDTSYLGIERMPLPKENDSLWLDVWGMKAKTTYSFTMQPQNIPVKLKAYLLDRFLSTKTPISLVYDSTLNFTTTNDKGSYAEDRFVIVFAQAGALASTGTIVKGWQQDKGVQVQWTTANEQDVQQYAVERATDGQDFTILQSNAQPRNSGKNEVYTITDKQPSAGDNYYRIQVVTKDGNTHYSNTVKLIITKGKALMSVYPNPVSRTEKLYITMTNMDAGKYTIQLFASDGKQLIQRSLQYDGSAANLGINLPASTAAGSYRLILLDEKGNMWKQQVIIQ